MIKKTELDELIYLDWNSYGMIAPSVLEVMQEAWLRYANTSSKHALGQRSKAYLDELTKELLQGLGVSKQSGATTCTSKLSCPDQEYKVIFTSGASEVNVNLLRMYQNLYVSDIEHPSIWNCPHATIIPVNEFGQMDLNILENHICAALESFRDCESTFLVSYMLANHETGIINNIREVAQLTHKYGGYFHTDAVQAFGRIDIDLTELDVDYITIASHKIGGPIGVGALVYRGPLKQFATSDLKATISLNATSDLKATISLNATSDLKATISLNATGGTGRLSATTVTTSLNEQTAFSLQGATGDSRLQGDSRLRDEKSSQPTWGDQIRMGTVALPLIAGMVHSQNLPRASNEVLENLLVNLSKNIKIIGKDLFRLNNTTCIECKNKSELMMALDLNKVCVSTGAACTAGRSDRAHSLVAMGINSDTIRISSGWSTSEDDFIRCAEIISRFT